MQMKENLMHSYNAIINLFRQVFLHLIRWYTHWGGGKEKLLEINL